MVQQPERKYWSARRTVLLTIAASLLLGFIAGRFSSGLKPKLGWFDPDVLFVEIMWVLLVVGALALSGDGNLLRTVISIRPPQPSDNALVSPIGTGATPDLC